MVIKQHSHSEHPHFVRPQPASTRMSSLAGALDETHVSYYVGFGDTNMSSPSRKGIAKEEQDLGPKEEGDQEMDDLFGNDQEVIEPKHEE